MKRKLVKQGGSAITITLPKSWVDKYGLKPGDEINIEERGRELSVGTEKGISLNKVSVNVSGLNERTIEWVLSALHKSGYDSIEIIYGDSKTLDIIQKVVNDLMMGFVIMEQGTKRCVIKRISEVVESEFDATLRRAFLVTLSFGENSLELINSKKYTGLHELDSLEKTNNQLTNFCERILNKGEYKDYRKTTFLYVLCWNLEKACDDFRRINEYLATVNSPKISKNTLMVYSKINVLFRSYYELFYNFELNILNKLSTQRINLIKDIQTQLTKSQRDEIIILNYLLTLVYRISAFSASFIALDKLDNPNLN